MARSLAALSTARSGRHQVALHLVQDLGAPAELEVARRRRAQDRVPQREREENVGVDDDDEGGRHHERSSGPLLLRLRVVAAELLRHLGELAEARAAVLVAHFLECEHVLDAQPPMLAGLAEWEPVFVE